MRHHAERKQGFTLIELLVVIGIIALLAAILFPVFAKARAKARGSACLSNIRQLSLGCVMFKDDNGAYPDAVDKEGHAQWVRDLVPYADNNEKIFNCPADQNGQGFVSYNYNGLMVGADGKGVKDGQVSNPSEVGIVVDGVSAKYPGGLVLNYAINGRTGGLVSRHSFNIGYADGHASTFASKASTDTQDIQGDFARAFYLGSGFGWVTNPGAGVTLPSGTSNYAGNFTISGSTTCDPIWKAAVAGWVAKGNAEPSISLTGSGDWNQGNIGGSSSLNKAAMSASTGITASTTIGWSNASCIATDAAGVIVSGFTELPLTQVGSADITSLFRTGQYSGGSTFSLHIYTRDADSGSGEFFLEKVVGLSGAERKGAYCLGAWTFANVKATLTVVASAQDMIAKVAEDPYGIGYAGLGEIDPHKVKTLNLVLADGTVQKFSRAAVNSGSYNAANGWYLIRPLFGRYNSENSANLTAQAFMAYVTGDFLTSLTYKSSFFPPKPAASYPTSYAF